MFTQQLMGFILAAVVMAVVSSELYALLKAGEYAKSVESPEFWGMSRKSMAWARYLWASPLLHEFFCARLGTKPAYRTSIPFMILVTAVSFRQGFENIGFVTPTVLEVAGIAMVISLSFFAAAYGKAFVAARKDVEQQTKDGTWAVAYA